MLGAKTDELLRAAVILYSSVGGFHMFSLQVLVTS